MKRSPLRKVSKKRAKENRLYAKVRAEYLFEHPKCEVEGCNEQSTQIHHRAGRTSNLLVDKRYFMACCYKCHQKIEKEKEWAMKMGYRLDKIGYGNLCGRK